MTLAELEADIYSRLNLSETPPTRVVDRIRRFINERHRRILTGQGIAQLRDDVITFDTVSGQSIYALPPVVGRINRIYNASDDETLTARSLTWLRANYPTPQSGDPDTYVPLGLRAVQRQPSAAAPVYVVSTSDSDVTHATVEFVRTGGYQDAAAVYLTGTTPVQVGSYSDIIGITNFQLEDEAVGVVTLTALGDTLATISPNKTSSRYLGIQLHPTPADADTFTVDYTREIEDLVYPGDVPLLPQDFHYLLSLGARIDEYEHLDDDRRNELQGQFQLGIKRLLSYVVNTPDYIVVPGGISEERSSLGGDYPAGS